MYEINNNERENPLISLLFFGLFFGSVAVGICGAIVWNNPIIIISGFMCSLAVILIAAVLFFWHRDQVKSNVKEYKIILPYVLTVLIGIFFLAATVVGFWLDIAAITICGALGFILTAFAAIFTRNVLIVKITMSNVKNDPVARRTQGEVLAVYEHGRSLNQTIVYKVIVKIDDTKSICYVKIRMPRWGDSENEIYKKIQTGNTVEVMFNQSKPKYCLLIAE